MNYKRSLDKNEFNPKIFMCSVCFLFTVMSCDVYGRLRAPPHVYCDSKTEPAENGERGSKFRRFSIFSKWREGARFQVSTLFNIPHSSLITASWEPRP